MAIFVQTNPVSTQVNQEQIGKEITFFTVNYTVDVSGSAGPNGAQQAVLRTIQNMHTIVATGPLIDASRQQTFGIEGPLWTPQNGANLQAQIRSLGTVDSVNLASTVVVETRLGILANAAVV